jgi:hypothetical protein
VRVAVRHAIARPERYLAAALAEWTDEYLAAELGCRTSNVWRLGLCGWPRTAQWNRDVAQMAAAVGCPPAALAALLDGIRRGV